MQLIYGIILLWEVTLTNLLYRQTQYKHRPNRDILMTVDYIYIYIYIYIDIYEKNTHIVKTLKTRPSKSECPQKAYLFFKVQ